MPEETDKEVAMKFAMRLIGLRRRSELEIRKKLQEKGFGRTAAEGAIEELKKFGYIDDEKFAESYINDRMNLRPAGKLLIKMELRTKGVMEPIINRKLDELFSNEKEIELAENLARKRLNGLNPANLQDRLKLTNYLKSRGFSSDAISQAIENIVKLGIGTTLENQ